jgi:hypothetical protein
MITTLKKETLKMARLLKCNSKRSGVRLFEILNCNAQMLKLTNHCTVDNNPKNS